MASRKFDRVFTAIRYVRGEIATTLGHTEAFLLVLYQERIGRQVAIGANRNL